MADVARTAGVSTATVSRALSDPTRVDPATRDRIMDAVTSTGYRANAAARSLRVRRAGAILVLAPNLANPFFNRIVVAVTQVADAHGLAVQLADSRAAPERLATLARDGRADGIVLLDASLDPAVVRGWPLPVVQACEWNAAYAAPGLAIDNHAAMGLVVDHLGGLGHRRILHVAGPEGNVLASARTEGFVAACAARAVQGSLEAGDFTMESGARAARAWAARPDRPTAVSCASDECAIGFIGECWGMGLAVPRDVSVAGFDDIEVSARLAPPLTTIHQPRARLGAAAAERLIAMIGGADHAPEWDVMPAHLVARGSTAAPPAS
ncbi:LacI family DNA-binding transcriptional regulator [Jannaschia sp. LMIT008]|uniref:LacI family DNA-binding transcriptional regulator n=1 Tax=Jannaschia maritima TaxID=3032585 RepID=UPI0028125008|nr:LacI family DNA-binding transcriptional regulator [Jannaschia sp. LMIT008]